MSKQRLDQELVRRRMVDTRSQAESYIKLGYVNVDDRKVTKPGHMVYPESIIKLNVEEQYVSRAALKLKSVSEILGIDFSDKVVLDVGSSTGGFTDFALKNGAKKVIAVELGTNQMHQSLRQNPKIELHEKTDIRNFASDRGRTLSSEVDVVLADVSFISLREILPSVAKMCDNKTDIYVMVKPQFEASNSNLKHKGVIKNDKIRREILKDFEMWAKQKFIIVNKADSSVSGSKGNT